MKNLLKNLNYLFLGFALVFMYSCQDEEAAPEEQGGVEFILAGHRVDDVKMNGLSSKAGDEKDAEACDMALASYAVLELAGETYTIDMQAWGDGYKTDLIELDPDTYQVTSFQLYDADDNPLYATPMADSEFGPFVSQSLPFDVTVENYRKIEYDL